MAARISSQNTHVGSVPVWAQLDIWLGVTVQLGGEYMYRVILGFLTVLLFAISAASPATADDSCAEILANGIWAYDLNSSDTHNVSAFLNWYGSTNSGSSSSSRSQSLDGNVYGTPVSLGLSNDASQNSEFFSHLEKLNAGYDKYDQTLVNFVKSASPVIAKAWSDCMSAGQAGILASIKFTDNTRDVIIALKFTPIDNISRSARVHIDVPVTLQCTIPRNHQVLIGTSEADFRCTRTIGSSGAIVLSSSTVIHPNDTVSFPRVRLELSGPYAVCDVINDIPNGRDTLGPATAMQRNYQEFGGGTGGTNLALQAPDGYHLTDVQFGCQGLSGDNPCAFVRNQQIVWTVPDIRAESHPTTDSDRVGVWISGTKRKVSLGFDQVRQPESLNLKYADDFSVEFPDGVADVKLYCQASGAQTIISLSDIANAGDQIYLRGVRQDATGRIMDLHVVPFDMRSETQ